MGDLADNCQHRPVQYLNNRITGYQAPGKSQPTFSLLLEGHHSGSLLGLRVVVGLVFTSSLSMPLDGAVSTSITTNRKKYKRSIQRVLPYVKI